MTCYSPASRREFLRSISRTGSAFALAGLTPWHGEAAPAMPERPGVPESRLAQLAAGANVCRWFRHPRNQTEDHFRHYLGDAEMAMMARIGLKHVRLCVAPKFIMEMPSGAVAAEAFVYLDTAIERFQAAGMLVVIDIHNEDRAAELNPEWQKAFLRFWSDLATRLSGFDPERTVFEFMNEPVFDQRESEWNVLNLRLLEAVRTKTPEHTLITSGPNWGGIDGLPKLTVLPDRNVVYSFHCYEPFPFTHQGATWSSEAVKPLHGVPYPSSPEAVAPLLAGLQDQPASHAMVEKYGSERWNRERLARRFREGIEWGRRNGVPLYCGEFGVYPRFAQAGHRENWFRDFGSVLAENRIGWAVWGWDEGFGLDRKQDNGQILIDGVVAEALGLKAG